MAGQSIGVRVGVTRPPSKGMGAPPGYILLTDNDGAYLLDADGAYLMEAI